MQPSSLNDSYIDEGTRLLLLDLEDLYATLGLQLLGRAPPGTAAGIATYLCSLRSSCEAREFYRELTGGISTSQLTSDLRVIYEGLKASGRRYLAEADPDLRRSLCNENIFAAAEAQTRSSLAVVTVIIGAALRLPPDLNPVAITVGAIVLKLGLRNFCANRTDGGS